MIYGESMQSDSALQYIATSRFMFYLTGSRYFGNVTPESDHDYFVQDSPQLRSELELNGFVLECESYKSDIIMVAVYKRENVHVQVVTNATIKQRIQYRLRPLFTTFKPDKPLAKALWQAATKAYLDGMDAEQRGLFKAQAEATNAERKAYGNPIPF